MLGLGAFCASQPDYVINHFLECAVSSINVDLIEAGSLTLVQGFTILANLAQKMNKPNAAYVYLGECAVRFGYQHSLPRHCRTYGGWAWSTPRAAVLEHLAVRARG